MNCVKCMGYVAPYSLTFAALVSEIRKLDIACDLCPHRQKHEHIGCNEYGESHSSKVAQIKFHLKQTDQQNDNCDNCWHPIEILTYEKRNCIVAFHGSL